MLESKEEGGDTMKKRLLTLAAVAVIALSFTACGGGNAPDNKDSSGSTSASSGGEQSAGAQEYDVGDFTVMVPEKWFIASQRDLFGDEDEDGNKPVLTDYIGLIKDGTSEYDAWNKPTVYIKYYNDSNAEYQAELVKMAYDETEQIECVLDDGTECIAYEALYKPVTDAGTESTYYFIYIPTGDESCLQVNFPKDMDGVGLDIKDADVQTILNGITLG